MNLNELFDLGGTSAQSTNSKATTGSIPPKRPKTAKELNHERNLQRQADIEKRKEEMKVRAHKNGQRPEQSADSNSDQ